MNSEIKEFQQTAAEKSKGTLKKACQSKLFKNKDKGKLYEQLSIGDRLYISET